MGLDPEQKFDANMVEEALYEARSYYNKRDREVLKDLELYNQEFTLDLPDGFHEIKSPNTKSLPDRLADRLGGGRLQVHMEPRRPGEKERKHVEALEKTGIVLPYLMRRRAKYNPIRGMALHAFNRGAIVAKMQVDLNALKDMPQRKDFAMEKAFVGAKKLWQFQSISQFPVMLDVRPIESIYPDPETDGDNYVIEHYNRRVGDIKKNYPSFSGWESVFARREKNWGKRNGKPQFSDSTNVDYIEVWTKYWRAVMVDKTFISIGKMEPGPVPNLMGRVPYFVRYSGFGDPSGEPHQKCVSILRAIRWTSRSMSRLYSIVDTVAENEAYGAMIYKMGDSGGPDFEIGPGAKNAMDFPDMVKPYHAQGVNPSLLAALSKIEASNEYGSAASEVTGQAPQNGRGPFPASGVGMAMASGSASMLLDPVKGAIQDIFEDIIPFSFYLFDDVIEKEIPVFGKVGENQFVDITLKPSDIDGHYGPVSVELKMRAPDDDYSKWQLGIQSMQAGFPPEFVMEKFFGVENAESVVREMMARQLAYSPTVREQYLIPRLIERLKAGQSGKADALPGQSVPAPAGFMPPPPTMGMPPGQMVPGQTPNGIPPGMNGMGGTPPMANSPADAILRAQMGMSPGSPNGPMPQPSVVSRTT